LNKWSKWGWFMNKIRGHKYHATLPFSTVHLYVKYLPFGKILLFSANCCALWQSLLIYNLKIHYFPGKVSLLKKKFFKQVHIPTHILLIGKWERKKEGEWNKEFQRAQTYFNIGSLLQLRNVIWNKKCIFRTKALINDTAG
jgi:hypothetical protein